MCLNPGDLLKGRYKIIEQIGRGGFGKTYRAKDLGQSNHPLCVVKEITPPSSQDSQVLEQVKKRFNTEARALALLGEHPQIPKLFDYFTDRDKFYLIQEYIEGHELSQEITPNSLSWSEEQVISLLQDILEVLAFVHEQNIIHRDIKPSNLIRRKQDGKIVLIDFGAVKELGSMVLTSLESHLTQAIGTPGYMAAEQQSGRPQLNSDLYAAGMIAIQALTGMHPRTLPSDPKTGNIIWRYSTSDRPLLHVSPRLEEILNRMTSYMFSDRYYSATEALEDLRQIDSTNPSQRLRSRSMETPVRKRFPWLSWLGGGVVLIGLGIWGIGQLLPKTCPLLPGDDLSCGEEILVREVPSQEKIEGIQAYRQGKYAEAVLWLEKARKKQPNDPETLIYLNNAQLSATNTPFYTIAVAVPLGNPADGGDAGKEILRGVGQRQKEINQDKLINGYGLRVMIADDYNNPDRAVQVAENLVEQPDILAVIGHYSSDNTRAALSIYTPNNLVVLSPTSTAQTLAQDSPVFLRTVPQDSVSAEVLAHYLAKTAKQKKVALFYNPNSAYSRSLHERFLLGFDELGGQVVRQFDLSRSIFDANLVLNQSQERGAEGLVLFPDAKVSPYAFSNALKVIRANQNRYPMTGGDSLYTTDILQERSPSQGLVVAIPWYYLSSINQAFDRNARSLWGGSVSWRTATAYDAAQVLSVALKKQTSLSWVDKIKALFNPKLRRMEVLRSLKDPNFQTTGATGNISFDPNGDRHETITQLVKVAPSSCSPYGYNFIPIQYTVQQAEKLMCQESSIKNSELGNNND